MQEEESSHPSSRAEGPADRAEPGRPPSMPYTPADHDGMLKSRAEALDRETYSMSTPQRVFQRKDRCRTVKC